MSESVLIASAAKLTRLELAEVATPQGTATHRPVPHVEIVETLVQSGGELVDKYDLMNRIWPGAVVEELNEVERCVARPPQNQP